MYLKGFRYIDYNQTESLCVGIMEAASRTPNPIQHSVTYREKTALPRLVVLCCKAKKEKKWW